MTTTTPHRYINRELSLLDFQERVLSLAQRSDLPLLERVKFVAIVSQNLDEFFQVRVAGLLNRAATGGSAAKDGMTPREQLAAIRTQVLTIDSAIDEVFLEVLLPALEAEGIRLVDWDQLGTDDRSYLDELFEQQIFPVLTPLAVDPSHPFPFVSNLSLNLAVVVHNPARSGNQFARVKVPPILPRFIALANGSFIPIEQVIAAHLERLFDGIEIVDHFPFRVTRSADFAVEEEEANDLLEAMEAVLRFRQRTAEAVRLEVGNDCSESVLNLLMRELELTPDAVYQRATPLGLGDLWSFYGADRPELKDPPFTPTTQPQLAPRGGEDPNIFDVISAGDILIHHPYESFATSTGAFVAQAAADPDVLAIKQTLYRTSVPEDPAIGGEEAIVRSLMAAAEAGKQVVVLIELKARFDEAANISWAKMLENAGVHVVYGVSGLKTHSKILLVVRREGDQLKRYAHVGTGNYNPKTARLYEDFGLLTADPEIGADLSELFNALTGYNTSTDYRKILVAPTTLRPRLVEQIREQAARGSDGRILLKMNHLVDPEIIDELYAASDQGCQIELIVRGNCCLRAGVPGLSDNITARSIVGKYLEHSRVYRFGDPVDEAVYYLGSADLMQRNLNMRVEAVTPVTDPAVKRRLEDMIQTLLDDDELAWEMQPDGRSWGRVGGTTGMNAHLHLEEAARQRAAGPRPG